MGEVEIHLYGDWNDLVEKKNERPEGFFVSIEN